MSADEFPLVGVATTTSQSLPAQDKDNLLAELEARNASANMGMGDMDAAKFERDVSEGRLVQVCIRLENVGKKSESLDFLREHGLLPGDARKIA